MERKGTAHALIRVAQVLMISILVLAPFPFGSARDEGVFALQAGVCLLLVLWILIQIAGREVSLVVTGMTIPLLALLTYLLFTLLPMRSAVLEFFSPEANALYRSASDMISGIGDGSPVRFRITLTPFETEGEILKLVAYAIFFYLSLNLLRYRRGHKAAFRALILTGAILAFFGIVQNLWSNGKIYWTFESGSGSPFGPFANHNHFAGYMELALGLALGMLMAEVYRFRRKTQAEGSSGYFSWIWHKEGARVWFLVISTFVMIAALTASLSRGGVISFVLTFILFGLRALLARRPKEDAKGSARPELRRAIVAAGLAAILLLIGALSLSPRVRERWSAVYESAGRYRLEIWRDSVRAASDFSLTGSGLGSFRSVYPRYKTGLFTSETTHAENEYLEWVLEAGLLGSIIMIVLGFVYARDLLLRLGSRRDITARCLGLGALFSIVSLSFHNAVDFNSHIPSNALTLSAIAALCLVAISIHRGKHGERFLLPLKHYPAASPRGLAAIFIALSLAGLMGQRAYTRYRSLRLEDRWTKEKALAPQDDPDEAKLALLSEALAWAPRNHTAHFLKAAAYETSASKKGLFQVVQRRELLGQAEREILQALRLQPAKADYWAGLGRIEAAARNLDLSDRAFQQAINLGKTSGLIRRDYAMMLLLQGNYRSAAAQFTLARNYSPNLGLREMLDSLAARTSDRRVWESILRYQPEDLRTYASFLSSRAMPDLAAQMAREADLMENRNKTGP